VPIQPRARPSRRWLVAGTLSDLRSKAKWNLDRAKRENADPKEITKLQDTYDELSRKEDIAIGRQR